ncbi:probable leucine-rich repeat receptor-like protein kinase IMK3 [Helianthus annuus]|uniref:probable leucine-rich repeat receptor-like protein kinase IMK3 n=1 Tax=Helianthus annuus TaxID=4232 RepID=UPI001652E738|nr:probable leucine-rich repeat receptor-like protein kinase IMK3 [Helianthus annuus]
MGFSKIGPANQKHTYVITNAAGTLGYCDPQYMKTCSLTKESDIYSFGVVLFEVLCGRLCYTNPLEILVPKWKKNYEDNKLRQIIFKDLTPHMDPTSLKTFSDIAFQCSHDSRERRPTTSFLVKKLEIALQFQERHDMNMTNVPTSHKSRRVDELSVPLSNGKGVLFLNTGKVVISYFDSTMPFTVVDLFCAKVETMGTSIYGSDYKATLENGFEVAVKRLRIKVTKSDTEFEAELEFIGKVRHPNLLATRACYLDPNGDKILVFDYMRKGSRAAFLHAQGPKQRVDWPTRMQITKGVARGLQSLHTHHNIIHGNLTSSNVLLDENINPKISDFGLSRLMTTDEHSHMVSTAYNLGYQAPEVTTLNKANTKADVYSLGMIMLELLTGKSPGEVQDLPQWVVLTAKKEWTSKVFDHELMEDDTVGDDELLNSLKLAMRCVHPLPQVGHDELLNSLTLFLKCMYISPWDQSDVQLVLQKLEEIKPDSTTSSRDDGDVGSSLS